ncbi:LAMI_0A00342g1_1 [Lachancea mirantina]|uniref:LAMI_0A00342g1_1 n=1 Tax=Lachancea mirantina TaxID=1230905 RepID=A0A1G4ILP4_9SACH|nr:LAMI_0A00342g1_1 [Lachancea mirantina]
MYESPVIEHSKFTTTLTDGLGTLTALTICDGNMNEKCHRYTGIRFAKPPVGQMRWRRPQPLPQGYDYSGDYSSFRTICPQPFYNNRGGKPNPDFKYDEDCLFLNIWVPASEPPSEGWPVLYFIHGGWLQVGNPLHYRQCDPQDLQAEDCFEKFILVSPGYRLNIFGFLACKELLDEDEKNSNFGFWDQRLGLEWVYQHISKLGGNSDNITVGGVSAGSYSSIFQIAYELNHPEANQIIKKVLLLSNGLAIQPKSVAECEEQYQEVLETFDIDSTLPGARQLEALRDIPFKTISDKILDLNLHTFRGVTDNDMVSPNMLRDIVDGTFGNKARVKGTSFIIGEVINEHAIYSNTNPPKSTLDLFNQINNYYPKPVTKALLDLYPDLPKADSEEEHLANLKFLYGKIISDGQVYASSRVLVNSLIQGSVPADKINRYQIAFRGSYFDKYEPPEILVPHAGDMGLWFYNYVDGILPEERPIYHSWLKPYCQWLKDGRMDWGSTNPLQMRFLNSDGSIEVKPDSNWEWGLKVGNVLATASGLSV